MNQVIAYSFYAATAVLAGLTILFIFKQDRAYRSLKRERLLSRIGEGSLGGLMKANVMFWFWLILEISGCCGAVLTYQEGSERLNPKVAHAENSQPQQATPIQEAGPVAAIPNEEKDKSAPVIPATDAPANSTENTLNSASSEVTTDSTTRYMSQCVEKRATDAIKLGGLTESEATDVANTNCIEGKAAFNSCMEKSGSTFDHCFDEAVPTGE